MAIADGLDYPHDELDAFKHGSGALPSSSSTHPAEVRAQSLVALNVMYSTQPTTQETSPFVGTRVPSLQDLLNAAQDFAPPQNMNQHGIPSTGPSTRRELYLETSTTPPRHSSLFSDDSGPLLSPLSLAQNAAEHAAGPSGAVIRLPLAASPSLDPTDCWSEAAPNSSPYASSNFVAEYLQQMSPSAEQVCRSGFDHLRAR